MQPRLAARRLERVDLHNCSRYARSESNKTLLNLGERPIRGLGREGNEDACGDLDRGVREPLNPASAKGKASPPTPSRKLHHSGPSGKCYWSCARCRRLTVAQKHRRQTLMAMASESLRYGRSSLALKAFWP
jgi:hypothetical protein